MSNIAIEVNKISKQYRYEQVSGHDTLRDLIANYPRRIIKREWLGKKKKFWALKDITFNVPKGEAMGLIGRNGAGKSTLLKILARIVTPTSGSAVLHGKTASLLEVGTGFHQELTGRENVYLNGSILGMKKREINKKFDKIVDFSGIEKFIDTPVKRYSSGMRVRLAFSVAAHLDPEILIIDEVLAVGDLSFRTKSLEKMQSIVKNEGRTVIFVSHSMPAVNSLCTNTVLLDDGKVVAQGDTDDVVSKYVTKLIPSDTKDLSKVKARTGSGKLKIVDFWVENEKRNRTNYIRSGKKCYFVFKYKCPSGKPQKNIDMGFAIKSIVQLPLSISYMSYTNQVIKKCPPKGVFVFEIPKLPLASGDYKIGTRVMVNDKESDHLNVAAKFKVEPGDFYKSGIILKQRHSPFYINGSWVEK
jgi:lipopolysaccharide transport system ATP-binding protein